MGVPNGFSGPDEMQRDAALKGPAVEASWLQMLSASGAG
jgi:hypothetical protein